MGRGSPRRLAPLVLATISCDIGRQPEQFIRDAVGPHEIDVAGAETATVNITIDVDSSRPITTSLEVAIEGVEAPVSSGG